MRPRISALILYMTEDRRLEMCYQEGGGTITPRFDGEARLRIVLALSHFWVFSQPDAVYKATVNVGGARSWRLVLG